MSTVGTAKRPDASGVHHATTNPPPSAAAAARQQDATGTAQTLKRSVQAAFEEPSSALSSSSKASQKNSGSGFSYTSKVHVLDKYKVVGFISSGTYGRVYKAIGKDGKGKEFAIKKFKPDKEGEAAQYTGISQSAVREMSLCSELSHPNIIHLVEIILEDKCIFMVFEYCEHDLLQIIQHHSQGGRVGWVTATTTTTICHHQQPCPVSRRGVGSGTGTGGKTPIPAPVVKSTLFQLLNGLRYLHCNWVLHRDLKPANIMLTSSGAIRIGDLGLARLFRSPLNSLYSGDKVVVTIWYRAPELLLGSRHYTPAIDLWAVGCIFAELLGLRPIFKGEEAKMDGKKGVPFQRNQMGKIVEVLGMPDRKKWEGLSGMPEYGHLATVQQQQQQQQQQGTTGNGAGQFNEKGINVGLERWYHNTLASTGYPPSPPSSSSSSSSVNDNSNPADTPGEFGLDLLNKLLEYDPTKRLTAEKALQHPYFAGEDGGGKPSANCFEGVDVRYPHRRVSQDDNDIRTVSLPGTRKTVGGAAGAGGGGMDEGLGGGGGGGGGKRGRYMGD